MEKEIFVSETVAERRIAVLENGVLVEIYVEKPHLQGLVGNIYKGKVENVIPGMQAAFVDIGHEINSFLPFSEIDKIAYGKMNDGSNFIQIFSKSRSWKICPDIRQNEFKNNYYEQSLEILKQKCPHVQWVEMKWLEWK